ncbi:hypothetical protein JTE90_012742 [Oedothorax gibbosus]|uniref:Uncharacterized protein n=1 Tax=Oedothorax gibbosus TaxID=931172 RepID=A0AAV6W2J4_9ARAC|nr:hypothetical protein JTE90_012742 [Oedothorax gibbosus]
MLNTLLILSLLTRCHAIPPPKRGTDITSRQASAAASAASAPLNAALVGLFSPPFVVLVGLSGLLYTFEKFTKDMVKAASEQTRSRFRRRKKKPQDGPATPIPTFAPLIVPGGGNRRFMSVFERLKF